MSRLCHGGALPRLATLVVFASLLLIGCSGSSSPDAGPAGGAVAGAQDAHCAASDGGIAAQPTAQASCHPDAGMGGMDMDAGPTSYGDTRFNAEGYDDDCKYHLSWTSSPVRENVDVTFTVKVTSTITGAPVTGANIYAEVFLNDVHPAPNSNANPAELGGGSYTFGPVRFDAKGRWTVRFHLFEQCSDLMPDSPHGHAAYFVDVP